MILKMSQFFYIQSWIVCGMKLERFEVYKNNELGYACENKSVNGTFLSKTEIPSLEDINLDVQFEACEIDKEYFESIWHKAVSIDGI